MLPNRLSQALKNHPDLKGSKIAKLMIKEGDEKISHVCLFERWNDNARREYLDNATIFKIHPNQMDVTEENMKHLNKSFVVLHDGAIEAGKAADQTRKEVSMTIDERIEAISNAVTIEEVDRLVGKSRSVKVKDAADKQIEVIES